MRRTSPSIPPGGGPPARREISLEEWLYQRRDPSVQQDGAKTLNSISDKVFDDFTPVEFSEHELKHGVHQGQRFYGDVRDLL